MTDVFQMASETQPATFEQDPTVSFPSPLRAADTVTDVSQMASETQPATAEQDPPPQASLLGLPPELRNRIYREVLVKEELAIPLVCGESFPEAIVQENVIEPGLLRCCKKIRAEARPIFLSDENEFHTWIGKGKLEPQLGHWFWATQNRWIRVTEFDITWTNLEAWLDAYQEGRLDEEVFREVFDQRGGPAVLKVCMNAFNIVRHLDGVEREVVLDVLEEFADTVIDAELIRP